MDSFQQRLSLWGQIFTLRDVILSDRMTYICNATNARGENIKMMLGVIDVEPGKLFLSYGMVGKRLTIVHPETISHPKI